jgi:Type I phosphodiesterase / nucleotide pyrophosphatase
MPLPDYQGGSIVNLMSSIKLALGGDHMPYPALRDLPASALAHSRNLVLLVVDGLGYEYLVGSGAGSTLRRHLRGRMTSVFPSTTASAITTFLTGLAPQQHALTGWHMYFRELGAVISVLPFTPRCASQSLGHAGINAEAFFGHASLFDRVKARCYVVSPNRIAHSDFNLAHCGKAQVRGYNSLAQFLEAIAALLFESGERSFIYAYYPEIDALAHVFGMASGEIAAHFAQLDAALAIFLKRIAGADTTVIVTADHGFIDSDGERVIELGEHPELAEMLLLPLCGERRAAYCYLKPGRAREFERYVETRLADYVWLHRSEELIEQRYFGLGTPHPRLLDRIGDYTLIMKHNYVIKDWLPGEHRHVHRGVHGGVSEQEMYVPLVVIRI